MDLTPPQPGAPWKGSIKLLRRLLADRCFERILGMDVSHRSLEIASSRLKLEQMPERQRKRIDLIQGSLLYRDNLDIDAGDDGPQ